jgi:hypothetical protein
MSWLGRRLRMKISVVGVAIGIVALLPVWGALRSITLRLLRHLRHQPLSLIAWPPEPAGSRFGPAGTPMRDLGPSKQARFTADDLSSESGFLHARSQLSTERSWARPWGTE